MGQGDYQIIVVLLLLLLLLLLPPYYDYFHFLIRLENIKVHRILRICGPDG